MLHALRLSRLIIIKGIGLVANPLHFYFPKLDLGELVLLMLRLLDDQLKVALADLALCILLIDAVLVLYRGHFTNHRVNELLFVIPLHGQVLIDDLDRALRHLLLLLIISLRKFVDDLLIAVLKLTSVLNLRVQIIDDLLLDVVRHCEIGLIVYCGTCVKNNIHE